MKTMFMFLTAFLLIYGGMHLYLLMRLRVLLEMGFPATILTAAALALFVILPILVRLVERAGYETVGFWIACTAYTWMGFIFLTFSLSLFFDVLRWSFSAAGFNPRLLTVSCATVLSLVLGLGFSAWGWYEARNIGTTTIVIETEKLPAGMDRFRIVQISDVHLGLVLQEGRLAKILAVVRAAGPDLLVATGDLVDGQMDSLAGSKPLLREINPPHGKYAVMGNHEFYAGARHSQEFLEAAGFRVLRGDAVAILDGAMVIAGVDDPAGKRMSPFADAGTEEDLLAEVSREKFRLLLKHQPRVSCIGLNCFDLQLSGHTHRGQIVPFNLVTRLFYRYSSGYHQLPGGGSLYVSRGAGTWGPAIRVCSPPEVVVIDLVRKAAPDGM